MAIFSRAISVKWSKMAIIAIIEWPSMANNMVPIGVYGKNIKNVDHL